MMRLMVYIKVVLMLFALPVMAMASATIDIKLQPSVKIDTRTIYLGQIADLTQVGKSLQIKLEKLTIGVTNRAGYKTRISRDDILRVIKRQNAFRDLDVQLHGADMVEVGLVTQELSAENYVGLAEAALYESLVKRYTNVELNKVGIYKNLYVPKSDVQLKLAELQSLLPTKRMPVMLEVYCDNELYSKIPIWFEVKARAMVYRLKQEMPASTIISDDMLETELLDVSELPAGAVTDKREIIGKQITEVVSEQRIIVKNDLHTPYDVVAGQKVTIRVHNGAIILHTSAIAIENGNKGKIIKLRNIGSKEIFLGKIMATNLVESI